MSETLINIEEHGDLSFQDGSLVPVSEKQDIIQNLLAIFNTRKGEFFLDIDLGLDYTPLETKGSTDNEILASLMDAIEQEERVTEIVDISIERDVRRRLVDIKMTLKAKALIIELQEVLPLVWN